MKEQLFQVFRSAKAYKNKPSDTECRNLNYKRETLVREVKEGKREPFKISLNQLKSYLEQGYSINASIMKDTRLLILDLDNGITEKDFFEICDKWGIVPNIYYRTFSYVKDVNERFRAIYKLDKAYNLQQYKAIYDMFLTLFSDLDTTSSNFKQLCHGTDKEVRIIHGESLKPRELAERTGWKPKAKVMHQRKDCKTYNGKPNSLTVEGILKHFEIDSKSFHFEDARDIYMSLREFGLEDRLNLETEEKRENYFESFERAYTKGIKPRCGSIGGKLFWALKETR